MAKAQIYMGESGDSSGVDYSPWFNVSNKIHMISPSSSALVFPCQGINHMNMAGDGSKSYTVQAEKTDGTGTVTLHTGKDAETNVDVSAYSFISCYNASGSGTLHIYFTIVD